MAGIIDELKQAMRRGGIVTRLIGINVVLFVVFGLVRVVLHLFNADMTGGGASGLNFLALPAYLPELLSRPWTLFTYMFMHVNVWHVVFNMLWLYWFGQLALHFFSARHLRGLYVLGGLLGGVLFIVSYNVFPLFSKVLGHAVLMGASASILAIVVATAVREPNYKIRLMFIGSISLKWLAILTVGLDILLAASDNAGGHFAHLGGALAGWWFVAALNRGHDITAWINAAIDFIGGLFQPRQHKPKLKVRKNKARKARPEARPTNDHATDYQYNQTKKQQSEEIDRILEKIKQSGYAGLTADEKKRLFEASGK